MNAYLTIARCTADPELKEIQTAKGTMSVCTIRAAVDGAGEKMEDGFFNFEQYGPGGASAANVLKEGMQFAFRGRAVHSEWRDDNEKYRERVKFVGNFIFLDKKTVVSDVPVDDADAGRELAGVGAGSSDDDIPF